MSNSQIFLKKGVLVVQVVSAPLVPPAELSPELEAVLGAESRPEPLSVVVRQEKLLERLNLHGLAHRSPENVVAVRVSWLVKEWFRHIPPPLLEEVCASLRDMLEAGAIHLSQSPWCNAVVLVWKKKRMPPRRDWGWCSPRNRATDGTILLPLGATP